MSGRTTLKVVPQGNASTSFVLKIAARCNINCTWTPVFVACLAADAALPEVCRACELVDICGGGYLPHRCGRGRQFHNESVHCLDLKIVLRHVQQVIRQDLQPLVAAGAFSTSL